MRFSKRVKVFPGFRLNFSKSGVSANLGVKGASVSFTKKGTYLNSSISGTGISNRQKLGGSSQKQNNNNLNPSQTDLPEEPQILVGEIKSADADTLTSTSMTELKDSLLEVYNDRIELSKELILTKQKLKSAKTNYIVASFFLIGLIIPSFRKKIAALKEYIIDLETQLKNSFINIDVEFDKEFETGYNKLIESYKTLLTTVVIWDITSAVQQDTKQTRSSAGTVVTRTPVKFKFDNIDIIKSTYSALHFENRNGGDIYIYPAFAVVSSSQNQFGLIDLKDIKLLYHEQRFLEQEKIPSDSKVVGKTWAKVNKDGSPDKRFNGNYEIPIVSYGEMKIYSSSGLNESYSFSNLEKLENFSKVFSEYQQSL